MFNFGEGCGVLRCALAANNIPVVYVSPQKWKKALGLSGKEKEFALTRARELMPESGLFLIRKKDVGRADASLIAYWYANHGKK
jgi:hypothetical protein